MVDASERATGIFKRPEFVAAIEILWRPGRKDDPALLSDRGVVGSRPFSLRSRTHRIAERLEAIICDGLVRHGCDRGARTDTLNEFRHTLRDGRFRQVADRRHLVRRYVARDRPE